jgi:hypothetical protein
MLDTEIENGKTIGRDREEWREGEKEREREYTFMGEFILSWLTLLK